jgi:hypothetical protein
MAPKEEKEVHVKVVLRCRCALRERRRESSVDAQLSHPQAANGRGGEAGKSAGGEVRGRLHGAC